MLPVASHPTVNRALLAYNALQDPLIFEDYLRQQPPGRIVGYPNKCRTCPLAEWLAVLTQGNVEVTGTMLWLYDASWSSATAHSVDLTPWARDFVFRSDGRQEFGLYRPEPSPIYRADALDDLAISEYSAAHP